MIFTNDKSTDEIKDSFPLSATFINNGTHNCKDCLDTICCNRGQDKIVICPSFYDTINR